jgi:hypothetical protein
MKQENKEVLKDISKGALVVTKVVGKGLWWFTKKAAIATEHVLEKGADNLSEAMRTKDHQKTVWDGIVPTKYTVEETKKYRRHYTVREMDRRYK